MAAEENASAEGAPKNKKMLFIIIGAAAVVIIALAVVFMGGKKEKKGEGAEAKVEQKAEGGGAASSGGKEGAAGAAANIFPMEPFIVNIYDGQELRYLRVKVEFETASADAKKEIELRQAPLRDAILVLLTTKTLQDVQDLQGKNQLRDEIMVAVNKILPPGKVSKVYFTDFVVQ
ncbi:flagellar basal body-associated protein FliL [Geobacter metallireducens RCH3]|uniref:Flagellar protein FliL n=1 Tax=Geobacter metallireducens (strain ATCC 53774 / DSM 7210 / GS-15) TaxID=269799 RepID=Q39R09_GEOMG|nr:flagellar basal body-associated FliL family protein [Geobacter metallireducens]ABB33315.1 flagellar basal body-associated protein FliL [Geobacter metallireducens GS-15]EHP84282.1 flagellar basal body-associated protein FliL [Geobacter metallireducens RCH3]